MNFLRDLLGLVEAYPQGQASKNPQPASQGSQLQGGGFGNQIQAPNLYQTPIQDGGGQNLRNSQISLQHSAPRIQQFTPQQGDNVGQGGLPGQLSNLPQGGQFNPGFLPLQSGNLRFNQAPQSPLVDPSQFQGSYQNPQQGKIFY